MRFELFQEQFLTLILLFGVILGSMVYAAPPEGASDTLALDTSNIAMLPADMETIQGYRNNPDFQYHHIEQIPQGFWDSIWLQIRESIRRYLFSPDYKGTREVLKYLLILAALVYLVYKLSESDVGPIFIAGNKANKIQIGDLEEDIDGIDYDKLIPEALDAGHWRYAARLYYLYTLHTLNAQGLISFLPEKTNSDYLNELAGSRNRQAFRELTYYFEYIWYGDFPANKELCLKMATLCKQLRSA